MIACDFFCGAGGLTRGMSNAGAKVAFGVDVDKNCRESYEYNNPKSKFIHSDIWELDFQTVEQHIQSIDRNDLLFSGCAPCQTFSQQRKGKRCNVQGRLLSAFGEFVEHFLPGQIFVENVPGIARVRGFSTLKRFEKLLRDNDYSVCSKVIDAKKYGVPQNRRRFVLLAMQGAKVSFPDFTHGKSGVPYNTVRDAISHFPRIAAGKSHAEVPNHDAAEISPLNLERLRSTPKNGGDRRSWPKHLQLDCHKKTYQGHTDVYGRMYWDQPSPALTSKCNSISNGRYGHPTQCRAISLREAASLQTFPQDYVFHGFNLQIARQIGNAVPVLMAEVITKHLMKLRRKAKRNAA